jgi:S-DNA-T family DNA segregation ATPase FtsK/SpoIIIE
MATSNTDAQTNSLAPRNTRLNEIIAIALFALGVLTALCLISAAFNPSDESFNLSGSGEVRNLVGWFGAYFAGVLLQAVGVAAYLLPVLLLVAAWRRFRTRRIHAPLSRILGLVLLVLSVAALLTLSGLPLLFDRSVQPGGLAGTAIARALQSGLNTVGAAVSLSAIAAVGLLLATNFSFIRAFEFVLDWLSDRFRSLRSMPSRFRLWRENRKERKRLRIEARRQAKAERESEKLKILNRSESSRSKNFVDGDSSSNPNSSGEAKRTVDVPFNDSSGGQIFGKSNRANESDYDDWSNGSGLSRSNGRLGHKRTVGDDPNLDVEEMVSGAEVVRTGLVPQQRELLAVTAEKPRRGTNLGASIAHYKLPDAKFLNPPPPHNEQADAELLSLATLLAEKLREFNVTGQIKHICPGPVVTTYEFKPDAGVKYSRITSLMDDLCIALKAESIRIERMPGKPHVGIEVPNPERETILLREVIESRLFRESQSKLTIALGKTIDGLNYVADLAKMPHLLIAGATGAGKSVGVNTLVVSILYKANPDEVKFIMVDPKRLELGLYADIPHLATPIITDPKRAATSLMWAVSEMERRYKELAGWGVRNIDGYNIEVTRRNMSMEFDEAGEPWKRLPYIVIIIDELADLMMVSGHEVEESITRLAQMARAVGIHLVLATQRPSVDVITGLIKANFPCRISFRVSSKIDSRTIIDGNGAEQLLGKGDMLFLPPGTSRLVRVHGAYVDETEITRIVKHVKDQCLPQYDETITQSDEEALGLDGLDGERDDLFEDALRICVEMKRASTSVLQRRLRIGYGRAAAILDTMEREGFIGQADGARPRPVLQKAFEVVSDWDGMAASGSEGL